MVSYSKDMALARRFAELERQTRQAWADLDRPALAAAAVYDLRLGLRISRILRYFLRKDAGFAAASAVLDRCYRATSLVRDRQVGVDLIRELEQGWPRNRRRPSTALAHALTRSYPALGREVEAFGLASALDAMRASLLTLERRHEPERLRRRTQRHAEALDAAMCVALRRAMKRRRARDWHALRLAIKRYRFWVLTLEDALPPLHGETARRLKPLQVALGDEHDLEVLSGWLDQIADAPLDRWRVVLGERKAAARERANAALAPLLQRADAGFHSDGIS
jgi:CHAD domain-containing protein